MAKIGNYNVLKVLDFWLTSYDKTELIAYTDQCQNFNLETTADKKEYHDLDGNLYYVEYNGKTGTLSTTLSMFNMDFEAIAAGTRLKTSGYTAIPRVLRVPVTTDATKEVTLTGAIATSIYVDEFDSKGTKVRTLTKDSSATGDKFAFADDTLTLPTSTSSSNIYIVRYDRSIADGGYQAYTNASNKFPQVMAGGCRALIVDPCEGVKVKHFECPKIRPSADTSIPMGNDADQTFDFNADLLTDYCGAGKALYSSFFVDGDEDDEDFGRDTDGSGE